MSERIKVERIKAGFSRPDIHRLIGIPVRTLENWENGQRKASDWEERLVIEKIQALAKERMHMTKYEVKRDSTEVLYKDRKKIKEGIVLESQNQDPETIASFDSIEDAKNELKKYESRIQKLSGGVGSYYRVEEYYIEECTYDEDGEWLGGGDVWEFSNMNLDEIE